MAYGLDTVAHRILRVPYFLFVRHKRIKLGVKKTYVFIHGLGDTSDQWASLVKKLPPDVNYIAMDLVGFGKSPKPAWAQYNAKMQARSVLRTCIAMGILGPVTVIGHSMGSLVAVEFAKRYRLSVRELVLCSPPIYDTAHGRRIKALQQNVLHKIYAESAKNPTFLLNAYAFGKKIHAVNQSLEVTSETLPAFLASLKASIMNQDTMRLIEKIKVPITIIDGQFDVLTINKVLQDITSRHANMTLITIPTMHVINWVYERKILEVLTKKAHKKEKHLQRGPKVFARGRGM